MSLENIRKYFVPGKDYPHKDKFAEQLRCCLEMSGCDWLQELQESYNPWPADCVERMADEIATLRERVEEGLKDLDRALSRCTVTESRLSSLHANFRTAEAQLTAANKQRMDNKEAYERLSIQYNELVPKLAAVNEWAERLKEGNNSLAGVHFKNNDLKTELAAASRRADRAWAEYEVQHDANHKLLDDLADENERAEKLARVTEERIKARDQYKNEVEAERDRLREWFGKAHGGKCKCDACCQYREAAPDATKGHVAKQLADMPACKRQHLKKYTTPFAHQAGDTVNESKKPD